MLEFLSLSDFHFLRPQWLWALVPLAVITVALLFRGSARRQWRKVIEPHLLEHLVVKPEGGWRIRPVHLLALCIALAAVAVAGPSWEKEQPPFTEDTAPMVIALDLSKTMLVRDVQPSRLVRAQQKIRDLLPERAEAKTALVAYAGTAHMVLPLTDDPSVLESYVTSLDPSVMPVEGKAPEKALEVAGELLSKEKTPGTILFLTDEIPGEAIPAFEAYGRQNRDQIAVLALGTPAGGTIPGGRGGEVHALDEEGFAALARGSGAYVTSVSVDDEDIQRIVRRMERHLTEVQQENEEGRWRDEGWWLIFPVALLFLPWSRKGWTIRWGE